MIVAELFTIFGVKMDSSWKKIDHLLESLVKKAAVLATAGAYGLERLIEHATESAAQFVSLSQAMGMTVRQAQEWDYVAQQSGSNLKELSVGVSMFLGNLRKFERGAGGKELAYSMRELGLSTEDAKKALSGPDGLQEVLLKVADRLKAMGNTGEAGALTTAIFGKRSGKAVLADMQRGAEGIRELQEHYRSLGAELSSSDALELRGLGNSITDAKIALNGLINQSLVFIAPIITDLTDRFIKFINVPENRREIMEMFAGVIRGIAKFAPIAGEAIMDLGHAVAFLGDHAETVKRVIEAIILLKIAAFFTTLLKALSPVGAALAGIKTSAAAGIGGIPTWASAAVAALGPLAIAATAVALAMSLLDNTSPFQGVSDWGDKKKARLGAIEQARKDGSPEGKKKLAALTKEDDDDNIVDQMKPSWMKDATEAASKPAPLIGRSNTQKKWGDYYNPGSPFGAALPALMGPIGLESSLKSSDALNEGLGVNIKIGRAHV